MPNGSREDDVGMIESPCELLRPGLVVDIECLRPRPPTVGAAKHTARIAPLMHVSLGGDHHEAGVARIDEHRRDLFARLESEVLPGASAVARSINAVSLVDSASSGHVSGSGIDDVRVG